VYSNDNRQAKGVKGMTKNIEQLDQLTKDFFKKLKENNHEL
jgi:hypothetical protein